MNVGSAGRMTLQAEVGDTGQIGIREVGLLGDLGMLVALLGVVGVTLDAVGIGTELGWLCGCEIVAIQTGDLGMRALCNDEYIAVPALERRLPAGHAVTVVAAGREHLRRVAMHRCGGRGVVGLVTAVAVAAHELALPARMILKTPAQKECH